MRKRARLLYFNERALVLASCKFKGALCSQLQDANPKYQHILRILIAQDNGYSKNVRGPSCNVKDDII